MSSLTSISPKSQTKFSFLRLGDPFASDYFYILGRFRAQIDFETAGILERVVERVGGV